MPICADAENACANGVYLPCADAENACADDVYLPIRRKSFQHCMHYMIRELDIRKIYLPICADAENACADGVYLSMR